MERLSVWHRIRQQYSAVRRRKVGHFQTGFLERRQTPKWFCTVSDRSRKKRNTPPADFDDEERYDKTDIYDELDESEKLAAIEEHRKNGFNHDLDETVECLHCGERYKFREVKSIRIKPQYRSEYDFDEIVCKNYPKCDGSIIDLMKIDELKNCTREGN